MGQTWIICRSEKNKFFSLYYCLSSNNSSHKDSGSSHPSTDSKVKKMWSFWSLDWIWRPRDKDFGASNFMWSNPASPGRGVRKGRKKSCYQVKGTSLISRVLLGATDRNQFFWDHWKQYKCTHTLSCPCERQGCWVCTYLSSPVCHWLRVAAKEANSPSRSQALVRGRHKPQAQFLRSPAMAPQC